MSSGTIQVVASIGGIKETMNILRSAAATVTVESTLDAGKAGTLSARTGDTEGTLTLGADHGITDGEVIAIFWSSGVAYLATVGTVAGTSVPFTGAAGDVLPDEDTAIVADVMEAHDVEFDGDNLEMLIATFRQRGVIVFEDWSGSGGDGDQVIDAADIAANEAYLFVADVMATNPLTGNAVDQIWIANGDSSNSSLFKLAALYNSES
ncbi:MAG: hypothetical protein PHI34_15520 [Acidobacteriota bacterium]|nr:hypothetical protein [Acidobacteriota bacterium]